jgi:hypothetical protein
MRSLQILSAPFVLGLLTCCESMPKREVQYPITYDKSTRICSIYEDRGQYFGKVVVIEGIYRSDLRNYSLIEDQHCPDKSLIRVETAPSAEESVKAFSARTMALCGQSFCLDDLHVAVEGRIVPGKAGHLGIGAGQPVIQLTRVLFFRKVRRW